jgi:hypothetical protein
MYAKAYHDRMRSDLRTYAPSELLRKTGIRASKLV